MVSLMALWLPILLSAVFVFIVSSVIHMLLPYHRSDFKPVPSEDQVMSDLRKYKIPPGDYMLPCGEGPESMKDPVFIEKYEKGPVALFTIFPKGPPAMGMSLALWFAYTLVVGILCALVAASVLPAGAEYHHVFHLVALTAFGCYSMALLQNSIWFKRKWSTTLKSVFDGVIYALLTAGTFGWLWP